jgi:predicted TIM-barrel fold metal-dependent hydrolase
MPRQYKCISADGHIDLNPDIWRDRVQAKWRDRAPKRVKMPNGSDAVVIDGGKPNTIGITRSVRVPHADLAKQVPTFETCAGTGGPEKRLAEQDQDGIDCEILFSQITFVLRQTKDDDFYRDCIRAYNEFLAEEYSAAAPDRLVCMGAIPVTNVNDAVKELNHCAKLGMKGVKLDRYPSGKSYPTAEDDGFWSAAIDLGIALTNHNNGSLGAGKGEPDYLYPKVPGHDVHQKDALKFFTRFSNDAMTAPMQMAFAGVWDRFPTLALYWAETQIGWLEFGLWQIDDHYRRYIGMIHDNWGLNKLQRKPSEYLKERNYWGFLHDPIGVKRRDCIGYDKLMWGSDFAHAASDFPNSQTCLAEDFNGVPENEIRAMLVDNCVRFFHLND